MMNRDDWLNEDYDRPTISASHPPEIIECVNWDSVLGYGKRPEDVYNEIVRRNKLGEPYPQELSRQITAIEHAGDNFNECEPLIMPMGGFVYVSRQAYNAWFSRFFGEILDRQKMLPLKRKGFWERLFD